MVYREFYCRRHCLWIGSVGDALGWWELNTGCDSIPQDYDSSVCTHQSTICCRSSATEGSCLPKVYFVILFRILGWLLLYILRRILVLHGRECALFMIIFQHWKIYRRWLTQSSGNMDSQEFQQRYYAFVYMSCKSFNIVRIIVQNVNCTVLHLLHTVVFSSCNKYFSQAYAWK